MSLTFTMTSKPFNHNDVAGTCAKCGKPVYESLFLLDDAWAVWAGRCPHCTALNLLSTTDGLRGYDHETMNLVLPSAEEVARNGLPPETPTREGAAPMNEETQGKAIYVAIVAVIYVLCVYAAASSDTAPASAAIGLAIVGWIVLAVLWIRERAPRRIEQSTAQSRRLRGMTHLGL